MTEPTVAALLTGLRTTTLADSRVRFSAHLHPGDRPAAQAPHRTVRDESSQLTPPRVRTGER